MTSIINKVRVSLPETALFRSARGSSHLYQKDCVDTSVELWRICHLCVLSPHYLTALCHQPEVTYVDLHHGPFGDDPQL